MQYIIVSDNRATGTMVEYRWILMTHNTLTSCQSSAYFFNQSIVFDTTTRNVLSYLQQRSKLIRPMSLNLILLTPTRPDYPYSWHCAVRPFDPLLWLWPCLSRNDHQWLWCRCAGATNQAMASRWRGQTMGQAILSGPAIGLLNHFAQNDFIFILLVSKIQSGYC